MSGWLVLIGEIFPISKQPDKIDEEMELVDYQGTTIGGHIPDHCSWSRSNTCGLRIKVRPDTYTVITHP